MTGASSARTHPGPRSLAHERAVLRVENDRSIGAASAAGPDTRRSSTAMLPRRDALFASLASRRALCILEGLEFPPSVPAVGSTHGHRRGVERASDRSGRSCGGARPLRPRALIVAVRATTATHASTPSPETSTDAGSSPSRALPARSVPQEQLRIATSARRIGSSSCSRSSCSTSRHLLANDSRRASTTRALALAAPYTSSRTICGVSACRSLDEAPARRSF